MREMKPQREILRIMDANANRAREGLRVCEDVCRFVLNELTETRKFKNLRHDLTKCIVALDIKDLISARDIDKDVGKESNKEEKKRKDVHDIFFANVQRAKESVRVLEECAKLIKQATAEDLKKIRYEIYACEKKVASKL